MTLTVDLSNWKLAFYFLVPWETSTRILIFLRFFIFGFEPVRDRRTDGGTRKTRKCRTPLHGHRLRTTLQLVVQQIQHRREKNLPHPNILTCRDVGLWRCDVANFSQLVVLYNMSVAGVRVVEFGTNRMNSPSSVHWLSRNYLHKAPAALPSERLQQKHTHNVPSSASSAKKKHFASSLLFGLLSYDSRLTKIGLMRLSSRLEVIWSKPSRLQVICMVSAKKSFYPRDAMLARVFAIATCLSGRLSVKRRYSA